MVARLDNGDAGRRGPRVRAVGRPAGSMHVFNLATGKNITLDEGDGRVASTGGQGAYTATDTAPGAGGAGVPAGPGTASSDTPRRG